MNDAVRIAPAFAGARTGARLPDRAMARKAGVLLACALMAVGGCAAVPTDPALRAEFQEVNDPAEPAMRAVFGFNRVVDQVAIKPAAAIYRTFVPDPVRGKVTNALHNLRSPVIFFNDLLQGAPDRAGTTLARFLVNSTVGVAGLFDPAADLGYPRHDEDFGQTLAVWGVAEGPYLVLPLFGPSNPRDAVGLVVDFLMDPFTWWAQATDRDELVLARGGVRALDARARNYEVPEDLERTSLDYYAAIRSLYRQYRADAIRNGAPADAPRLNFTRAGNTGNAPELSQSRTP